MNYEKLLEEQIKELTQTIVAYENSLKEIADHKPPLVGVHVWTDYKTGYAELKDIAKKTMK